MASPKAMALSGVLDARRRLRQTRAWTMVEQPRSGTHSGGSTGKQG